MSFGIFKYLVKASSKPFLFKLNKDSGFFKSCTDVHETNQKVKDFVEQYGSKKRKGWKQWER